MRCAAWSVSVDFFFDFFDFFDQFGLLGLLFSRDLLSYAASGWIGNWTGEAASLVFKISKGWFKVKQPSTLLTSFLLPSMCAGRLWKGLSGVRLPPPPFPFPHSLLPFL